MTRTRDTVSDLTRQIIGIENRTAQEVFDIMCDRIRRASDGAVSVKPAVGVFTSKTDPFAHIEDALYAESDAQAGIPANHPAFAGARDISAERQASHAQAGLSGTGDVELLKAARDMAIDILKQVPGYGDLKADETGRDDDWRFRARLARSEALSSAHARLKLGFDKLIAERLASPKPEEPPVVSEEMVARAMKLAGWYTHASAPVRDGPAIVDPGLSQAEADEINAGLRTDMRAVLESAAINTRYSEDWVRDTALNLMLCTESEEAIRTLTAALQHKGDEE